MFCISVFQTTLLFLCDCKMVRALGLIAFLHLIRMIVSVGPIAQYIVWPRPNLSPDDEIALESVLKNLAVQPSDVYASKPPLDTSIRYWVASLPPEESAGVRAHKMVSIDQRARGFTNQCRSHAFIATETFSKKMAIAFSVVQAGQVNQVACSLSRTLILLHPMQEEPTRPAQPLILRQHQPS